MGGPRCSRELTSRGKTAAMSLAIDRLRWLAPLLAAMALALAPQFAAAHSSHVDEPDAAAPPAADRTIAVPGIEARQAGLAVLSSSCPSGHGDSCFCHVPAACAGGGEIPVVNFGGWARP